MGVTMVTVPRFLTAGALVAALISLIGCKNAPVPTQLTVRTVVNVTESCMECVGGNAYLQEPFPGNAGLEPYLDGAVAWTWSACI